MQLTTNLTVIEIKEILKQNTVWGNPKIKGTPLAHLTDFDRKKFFYGTISNNEFSLTYNSLYFPIPYLVTGKMKYAHKERIIELEIKKIPFGYYWIRIGIPIIIIATNIILIKIQDIPNTIIILNNIISLPIFAFILNYQKKQRTKLLKALKEILQVNSPPQTQKS